MKTHQKIAIAAMAANLIMPASIWAAAPAMCQTVEDCTKFCSAQYCCPTGQTGNRYICPAGWTLSNGYCKQDNIETSDDTGYKTTTFNSCAPTQKIYDCYKSSSTDTTACHACRFSRMTGF